MRLLVVGSLHFPGSQRVRPRFEALGRELGCEIRRRGWELVVGSDSPSTFDRYVAEGYVRERPGATVTIRRPDDEELTIPFDDLRRSDASLRVTVLHGRTNTWAASRAEQVADSDAVLLAGGGPGTLQAGVTAPLLQRPVLALAEFGGQAKEVWKQLRGDIERAGVSEEVQAHFRDSDAHRAARSIVDAIASLVSKNPYRNSSSWKDGVSLGLVVILALAWPALFLMNVTGGDALFCAIGLAFVTSGIASTLNSAMESTPRPDGRSLPVLRVLMVTVALTFLVAVALLVSMWAITGQTVTSIATIEDYRRIGLWMSAVGAYAGLARRGTFELIRRRFQAVSEERLGR